MFNPRNISKQTVEQVSKMILTVDGMHIRQKSEGAAVFYMWVLRHVDNSLEVLKEKAMREAQRLRCLVTHCGKSKVSRQARVMNRNRAKIAFMYRVILLRCTRL